jgi:hypothetical protein
MTRLEKSIKDLQDKLSEAGSLEYVSKDDVSRVHHYQSILGRITKLRDLKLQADHIIDKLKE